MPRIILELPIIMEMELDKTMMKQSCGIEKLQRREIPVDSSILDGATKMELVWHRIMKKR